MKFIHDLLDDLEKKSKPGGPLHFIWPIIEAQACGCPVFTSNRPPMTEVGGEAAVYFDPSNEAEAAEITAKSLQNRPWLRERGLLNAENFSTESMILAYERLYQRLV